MPGQLCSGLKGCKAGSCFGLLAVCRMGEGTHVDGQLQGNFVVVHAPHQGLHQAGLVGSVIYRLVYAAHQRHGLAAQVGPHRVFVIAAKAHHHLLGVQEQAAAIAVNGWQGDAHTLIILTRTGGNGRRV